MSHSNMSLKLNFAFWTRYYVFEELVLSYEGFHERDLSALVRWMVRLEPRRIRKKQISDEEKKVVGP